MTLIDSIIEHDGWEDCDLESLAEVAARATLSHLSLVPEGFEISLLGCDDARIITLNADFRGKPVSTNVLSWPSEERGAPVDGAMPDLPAAREAMPTELGDIAIAYQTCAAEALAARLPLADHVTHLIVHAVLHLLGFDHIRDKDATLMEEIEVAVLGKLGVSDPYMV